MTSTDKNGGFWTLQEVFDYIMHRGPLAVNSEALGLIIEAQRKVFASSLAEACRLSLAASGSGSSCSVTR